MRRNLAIRVASSLFITLLLAPPPILAAARVVQERTKLQVPGPAEQRVTRIAFSGNSLLALGHRLFQTGQGTFRHSQVYLFERASASAPWVYSRVLFESTAQVGTLPGPDPVTMALEGNVAAVAFGTLYVYERTAAGWTQMAALPGTTDGQDVEIDSGEIVLSGRLCQWRSYSKLLGEWRLRANFGPITNCSVVTQDVDISASRIVLANTRAGSIGPVYDSAVQVFDGLTTNAPSATITAPFPPDANFGHSVAIEGNTILAGDDFKVGVRVFTGGPATGWNHTATLAPADTYSLSGAHDLEIEGDLIAIPHRNDPQRGQIAGSVEIQRRNPDGTFTEVARLLASDALPMASFGNDAVIEGTTVAVASDRQVYFFDLPADLSLPPRIHDNFNSGNAANWTPQAGSSFSVVTSGASRVYRQTSVAGNAASFRTNHDWRDQSIQADLRPRALDGNDRWVGLVVRYQDPNNYYYLTARSTGILQLKKIVNGTVTTLRSVGMPFAIGRNYRLGLQAIGTRLTMFENGRMIADIADDSLIHGSAGFMSYKMAADFDNVVLSPTPLLALVDDRFRWEPRLFTELGDGEWNMLGQGPDYIYEQSSLAGGARAITGIATRDQTVQVEARPVAFGAGPGRWFGLIARYVDDDNYYYVTVRNDNTLSLRKLVNGAIVELRSVPFPLTVGAWYQLRLEAIGTSLRVFVGDQLLAEATDSSFAQGRYGLAMYKASTEFDNFLATQQ